MANVTRQVVDERVERKCGNQAEIDERWEVIGVHKVTQDLVVHMPVKCYELGDV